MSHSSNILRQLTANKYYWGNRIVIWCQNLIVSRMFDHFQVKHQQNVKLLLSQVFKWLKFGLFPFQSTGLCFEAFKTKRPFWVKNNLVTLPEIVQSYSMFDFNSRNLHGNVESGCEFSLFVRDFELFLQTDTWWRSYPQKVWLLFLYFIFLRRLSTRQVSPSWVRPVPGGTRVFESDHRNKYPMWRSMRYGERMCFGQHWSTA